MFAILNQILLICAGKMVGKRMHIAEDKRKATEKAICILNVCTDNLEEGINSLF